MLLPPVPDPTTNLNNQGIRNFPISGHSHRYRAVTSSTVSVRPANKRQRKYAFLYRIKNNI